MQEPIPSSSLWRSRGMLMHNAFWEHCTLKAMACRRTMCKALKWYRSAAEQGHAKAQYYLGVMFDMGEGVPQDYVEAAKWYRTAAEQGLAVAQSNLGAMYGLGQGVPQDYVQALMWFNLAASQGYSEAQDGHGFDRQWNEPLPRSPRRGA